MDSHVLNSENPCCESRYHEQLNTAIKYELFSLSTIAVDWELKLVEPFGVNSRISSGGQENCAYCGQGWTSNSSSPNIVV